MRRTFVAAAASLFVALALGSAPRAQALAQADAGVPTSWRTVAAGDQATCAIDSGRHLYCWGAGGFGDGTTTSSSTPVRIGSAQWLQVRVSPSTFCGIQVDHSAWCWGDNNFGEVGHPDTASDEQTGYIVLAPRQVIGAVSWKKIDTGEDSTSCGITTAGSLFCWGYSEYGAIGDGTAEPRPLPTQVGHSRDWVDIRSGAQHNCGRTGDGHVYCWGRGAQGALGNGSTRDRQQPTEVRFRWAQLSAAGDTTCGVTRNGVSRCWGSNFQGGVGDHTTTQRNEPFTLHAGSTSFSSVLTGGAYSCGVTASSAKVRCFGDNRDHQFGKATPDQSYDPTDAAGGLTDWARVDVGESHSCAIRPSGALYCWGDNSVGQLGVGTTDPYDHRVLVGRTPTA